MSFTETTTQHFVDPTLKNLLHKFYYEAWFQVGYPFMRKEAAIVVSHIESPRTFVENVLRPRPGKIDIEKYVKTFEEFDETEFRKALFDFFSLEGYTFYLDGNPIVVKLEK